VVAKFLAGGFDKFQGQTVANTIDLRCYLVRVGAKAVSGCLLKWVNVYLVSVPSRPFGTGYRTTIWTYRPLRVTGVSVMAA
jgi:hypothetical protein